MSYTQTTVSKLKEWFWRYLPAEIAGTITALLAASLVYMNTHSLMAAAFAGSLGEAIGYYAAAAYREITFYYQKHSTHHSIKRVALTGWHSLKGMMIEFGPAEAVDGLFFRPYLLYMMPQLLNNTVLGWLVGKLLADVVFYGIAGFGYEFRKMLAKRSNASAELDPDD